MLQAELCDVITSSERATFIASKYAMLQSWEPVTLGTACGKVSLVWRGTFLVGCCHTKGPPMMLLMMLLFGEMPGCVLAGDFSQHVNKVIVQN